MVSMTAKKFGFDFQVIVFHKKITAQLVDCYRGDPDGNRTRVTAVKGRCLNRLTTGPYIRDLFSPLVAATGLEPVTFRV